MTTTQHLHPLLDELADTRELIIRRVADAEDAPRAVWRAAAADARERYVAWSAGGGHHAHAAYLAAEDQADAALASLRAASEED
ncbi:MAG: hypothetical protein H0V81_13680 [Solirubrobacterales bacterium]|nr:hypothetical protein [Solirubrobacterales bacterium]